MTSDALSTILQALLLVGSVATVAMLYVTGLFRKYPVFFAYFVFRIANSLWPIFLSVRSVEYFWLYIISWPIVLIFYVLMTRELYRLVLEDYRGLQTVGRWAMTVSLVCGVAIAVLTLLPTIQPSMPQRSQGMRLVLYSERGVDTALALFIVLLLALLSRYPIRLRRNVRRHAVVFSVFFLTNAGIVLVRTVLGLRSFPTLNLFTTVMNAACVFAWLVLLNRAGEEAPVKQTIANEHEERLLLQLQGLNAAMLRVSRR